MELTELSKQLAALEAASVDSDWPVEQLALLSKAGCWAAAVAKEYGGTEASRTERLEIYEEVAKGSLSLALILTQHDGAVALIGDCDNADLAVRLLPRFATGELLTTVGISQLTTSKRGKGPAMRAERDGDAGYRLNGVMPWVTSAAKADWIVTGAVLPDEMQILACVPTDAHGLTVEPPMQMMALDSSWTSRVCCESVRIGPEHLMRGPMDKVLASRAPVKPLTVSAVGIGVCGALLAHIRQGSEKRPLDFAPMEKLAAEAYERLRAAVIDSAETLGDPSAEVPSSEIRSAVNDLVVRLAVLCMTLAKGSGYVRGQLAERLVREAMFFLVWSAPTEVQVGTLSRFWRQDR